MGINDAIVQKHNTQLVQNWIPKNNQQNNYNNNRQNHRRYNNNDNNNRPRPRWQQAHNQRNSFYNNNNRFYNNNHNNSANDTEDARQQNMNGISVDEVERGDWDTVDQENTLQWQLKTGTTNHNTNTTQTDQFNNYELKLANIFEESKCEQPEKIKTIKSKCPIVPMRIGIAVFKGINW